MHKHCWHIVGGYTQGDGRAGSDHETCCHCGYTRQHDWSFEQDPKHGPYVKAGQKVYTVPPGVEQPQGWIISVPE